jgi:hypothetical protein
VKEIEEMKDEDGAERVLALNRGNMEQKVAELQIVIGHHFVYKVGGLTCTYMGYSSLTEIISGCLIDLFRLIVHVGC